MTLLSWVIKAVVAVAAAIPPPTKGKIDAANGAVQNWIERIRNIFRTSDR